jgi:hypothetical protein
VRVADYAASETAKMRPWHGMSLGDSPLTVVRHPSARPGSAGCLTSCSTSCADDTGEVELKEQIRDLFAELAGLENGMVIRLEFRHGL